MTTMKSSIVGVLLAFATIATASDCKIQTVVSGDSCGSLADRCGISPNDFTTYNPQPNLCSSLAPGQRVCCSSGSLPDIRPKPNPDGSCTSYTVKKDDTCSSIAFPNGLKVADLSTFNDKTTWGWAGCSSLRVGVIICLSKGTPPLPAPQSNAVCGPIKPGTKAPTAGTKIADLNPCPLHTCCNIWGQCGITPDFCSAETGATGNPGTAPPGRNGCISNCGTRIVNNGRAPASFQRVGYYESWNWDRSCLNMRANTIDTTFYTHIHWAFATVTANFDVVINDSYHQLPRLHSLNAKKVISFGGWGYSTDPATYEILRTAMSGGNAAIFAANIVKFVNANNWDGVDIDWEYPGAPDIPGIPPGLPSDGPNYLNFLRILRSKLPPGKTLSIAAPASFWYLKAFPISEMAEVLDYIVFMTYDLHGQWDYGNPFSQDGCANGNCLRSHVNLTETNYALAMITKAGVPASKINVGISSYGRSFKMTQHGCTGPMCTYVGPESAAEPGPCTVSAGYISNAEIFQILGVNETSPRTWYDTGSNSDIMVYDDVQWVAFMSPTTRSIRTNNYKTLNLGGIVDWAVDLNYFTDQDGLPDDDSDGLPMPPPDIPPCKNTYNSLEDLDAAAGSIPENCRHYYTLQALSNVLNGAVKDYNDMVNNGYDNKFKTYSKSIADSADNTIHDFVNQNGNKYFSCIVSEVSICCDKCKGGARRASECNYCFDGKCYKTCPATGCHPNRVIFRKSVHGKQEYLLMGGDVPEESLTRGVMENAELFGIQHEVDHQVPLHIPTHQFDHPSPIEELISKIVNESGPCPPDYSKRGYGPDNPYEQSVYWTLRSDLSDLFFADLLTNTGISKNKIKFANYDRGNMCGPTSKPGDDCWGIGMDYNVPVPNGYSAGDVANPKNLVQKALGNANDLVKQIQLALFSLRNDCYGGDPSALVDSISLPVLMVVEAVESMAQVDEVADKITEAQRKALILGFIGAILFLVPIAGEILGSVAELADLATVITLVGAAGNTAMDIYTIMDDPSNAPLAIFSLILEPLALTSLAKVNKAANIRRGMSEGDIAKLGGKVATRMGTIKKVNGVCRKGL